MLAVDDEMPDNWLQHLLWPAPAYFLGVSWMSH